MWSVAGRSACSATRSSASGRPGAVEGASAAGWSARWRSVSIRPGRPAGQGQPQDAGPVDPRVSSGRVRGAGPTTAGGRAPHAGRDVRARVRVEAGAAGADRGAGPRDHGRTPGTRPVPGLRTMQTHLARQGLNVRADGVRRGRSMAASRPSPQRVVDRGRACTAPRWPAHGSPGGPVGVHRRSQHGCWSAGGGDRRGRVRWRPRCAPG